MSHQNKLSKKDLHNLQELFIPFFVKDLKGRNPTLTIKQVTIVTVQTQSDIDKNKMQINAESLVKTEHIDDIGVNILFVFILQSKTVEVYYGEEMRVNLGKENN